MAKPMYITEQVVFDAANRLFASGIPLVDISMVLVRKEIGRGSPNDILPLLRTWKQKQLDEKGLSVDIPDEFKDDLTKFGSEIWQLAMRLATEKANQKYEEFHALKKDLNESNDYIELLGDELTTFKESLAGLAKELDSLKFNIAVKQEHLKNSRHNPEEYMNTVEHEMNVIKERIDKITTTYIQTTITPVVPNNTEELAL